MAHKTFAAVASAAVLAVISACAAPGAGAPSETSGPSVPESAASESATADSSASESSADDSATSSGAQSAPSSSSAAWPTDAAPAPQPGAEPWPPKLVLSDILEAGTTTVSVGKVSLTLPAGFVEAGDGAYTSTWPGASGPAEITIVAQPATGNASEALAEYASWARTAPVTIPNASSAAMADAVVDGVQTWGLAIVDSTGTATIATFAAAPQDFQDYLIYQSVSSVVVAA